MRGILSVGERVYRGCKNGLRIMKRQKKWCIPSSGQRRHYSVGGEYMSQWKDGERKHMIKKDEQEEWTTRIKRRKGQRNKRKGCEREYKKVTF